MGLERDEIETLKPDVFLVIIDDIVRVKERLSNDPEWMDQQFTLETLAKWRREEINRAQEQAYMFVPPKPFYIIAREHKANLLQDILFNPKKKKVYISYPITGQSEEDLKEVRGVYEKLSNYFVVFDPLTIHEWEMVNTWKRMKDSLRIGAEMPRKIECKINYRDESKEYVCDTKEVETAIRDIRWQIVDRDYKLIDSCDYVAVYHPRDSISAGVMCEMVHAKSTAKLVYVYYPFEPSPFFEWYSNRIFTEKSKFFDYLEKIAG